MATFYDRIEQSSKGAWVVHHSQKAAATINGAAEFPALDAAGKAASLLSQLAATAQSTLDAPRVQALAKAAGLSTRLELPEILRVLASRGAETHRRDTDFDRWFRRRVATSRETATAAIVTAQVGRLSMRLSRLCIEWLAIS
jgi:hypothetical protein